MERQKITITREAQFSEEWLDRIRELEDGSARDPQGTLERAYVLLAELDGLTPSGKRDQLLSRTQGLIDRLRPPPERIAPSKVPWGLLKQPLIWMLVPVLIEMRFVLSPTAWDTLIPSSRRPISVGQQALIFMVAAVVIYGLTFLPFFPEMLRFGRFGMRRPSETEKRIATLFIRFGVLGCYSVAVIARLF